MPGEWGGPARERAPDLPADPVEPYIQSMRNFVHKLTPAILGLVLGWLVFRPPGWMEAVGPWAHAINALLCAILLLNLVALVIGSNLPRQLVLEPVPRSAVHHKLAALDGQLRALGFRSVGGPQRVKMAPSAILLGYVHETEPVYATAFRAEHVRPRACFDFVSIFEEDRGGLTTNAEPDGAVLPAAPGSLRQVFPRGTPEELFQRHLDGLAFLRKRGIRCRTVSEHRFDKDFIAAIGRQREMFLAAPMFYALVALWRTATRKIPFLGELHNQKVACREIERLLARC